MAKSLISKLMPVGATPARVPWRDALADVHPRQDPFESVARAFLAAAMATSPRLPVARGSWHGDVRDINALAGELGGDLVYRHGSEVWLDSASGVLALSWAPFAENEGAVSADAYGIGTASWNEHVAGVFRQHVLPRPPPAEAKPYAYVLGEGMMGLVLRRLPPIGKALVRENYAADALAGYDHVLEDLDRAEPCGRFSLFSGEPGTGKTRLAMGLIDAFRGTDILPILVPPTLVEKLGDPGLVDVLIDAAPWGRQPTFALILEDADRAIRKRSDTNLSAVATLLNFSDGIVGQALDIRLIATTNAKDVEIDAALLRPGRMCAHVKVGRLPVEQAAAVARRLGRVLPQAPSYTLAEVYAAPLDGRSVDAAVLAARAAAA